MESNSFKNSLPFLVAAPNVPTKQIAELPWTSASDSQLVVVEAWLTLIEGLTTACVTCHKAIQPDVLQMQYDASFQLIIHKSNDSFRSATIFRNARATLLERFVYVITCCLYFSSG